MKKTLILLIAFTFTYVITSQCSLFAGGPLVVKGSMAITYGSRPLLYRYDQGSIGMFSNAEAIALIEDLFEDWESVATSKVTFQRDNPGSLDFDVNASNFDSILNSPNLLGYTPVIFDNDGTLLDAFLGSGAGNSVLGLAGPVTVSSGPLVNQIAESQAIFNGKFVNGIDMAGDPESSTDSFKGTIIHEFGHGFGLDHAQINVEAIQPGTSSQTRDSVPLMFPIAVNDLFLIRRDDASAASFLYPDNAQLSAFGIIEGKVFRAGGTIPVSGANVIARNINDPQLEAISCVSDFLVDNTGSFTLFAVPPGDYRIEIEPIDLSFTGGSGVGPFTTSKTDKSFQNPVPKGFYTGPNLPITTDQGAALIVNIQAGQTVSDVNIIASTTGGGSSSSSSSSSSTTGGVTTNEIEPNDRLTQAQFVSLPVTISGSASFGDEGEIELSSDTGSMVVIGDLFKFTLPQSSSINAHLVINSDIPDNDLDLVLFDEEATEIIDTSSQTGNTDELISLSLPAGTYILGVGAFSGSASYTLDISIFASGSPILTLSGTDTLIVKPRGMSKTTFTATANGFEASSRCNLFSSDESLLKIRPKGFSLKPNKPRKKFKVIVPKAAALELIANDESETVTISAACENGASDEFDLFITPDIDRVLEGKSTWQYIRKK